MSDEELEALDADFRKLHDAEYSGITKLIHQKVGHVYTRRRTK